MISFYNSLPKTLILILIFLIIQVTEAQTRYKDVVFSSVTTTNDIQFGSSLTVSGSNSELYLDLYEPTDDTLKSKTTSYRYTWRKFNKRGKK